ncbi:sulfatase [Maribellus sediminis]|uniref:sulfatase n=1 Tax=Maribellus sediminis TaxID=2696285 RepID=UPI00142F3DA8|nr:sulfatase [Maribellus sediminis]
MRRNLIILFVLILFSACVQQKEQKPEHPNVLFIAVDDLRPDLGCYGNPVVHSPNIDKLAQTGAVFIHQYAQIPTCGASRYSMLTGMLPKTKGHLGNEACRKFIAEKSSGDEPETFIHQLKNNGYYTVGIGKISHYADGLLYGYTDSVGTERELPNSWNELLFNPAKWKTGWNAFFGYADGENRQSMNRQVKPYESADTDDYGYVDGYTAELAVNKLKELAKKDEPFFLGVGFFKPHLPFTAPQKYWDLYVEEDLATAPFDSIPKNVNPASLQNSGELNGYQLTDEKASLDHPVSDAYAKKLRHAYYACISYTDAQIGKLLDELAQQGLVENTIVVIWGDHGWHLGDQRVWGKHTLFERALKSTFIVRAPGKTKGESIQQVVSSIDIYPTILDLCGVDMPHQTDGESLVPLLQNPDEEWQEAAYGYFNNGISVRTKDYRLTQYFRKQEPVIELYDHKNDPNESKNIAAQHPGIVEQLMPLLKEGDTGLYH